MRAVAAVCLALFVLLPALARPRPGAALARRFAADEDVIGIVHWGLNTYTGREWGEGNEDPRLLNPSGFDADRIVQACKAGGLVGLVVVAKHHDGFCLWPTKTTDYNVTKAPFRGGKGDYVREMADACRRAGLKFGVYCSPWDRHSADYGTAKYVETFHAQLKELLAGYGDIFELWFDGANGGAGWYGGAKGRRTIGLGYYGYDRVFAYARKLHPNVTVFQGEDDGSDFRWHGNERGLVDPDARATIDTTGGFANGTFGNPNYRKIRGVGVPNGKFFRACEADFPLRKGWFYRASEDGTTKSSAYLMKIYFSSVGNGGTMNVGISPNREGVLAPHDVRALADFGALRKVFFANEVTKDGEPFNLVVLREDLSKGEQVDGWELLADGRAILTGKAIGNKRMRLLPQPVAPQRLELRVTADGGELQPVSVRRYLVNPDLAKIVLEATTESGETETVGYLYSVSGKSTTEGVKGK